ncbi:hypothetical protein BDP27DRAFT_1430734 [Rhodocollybia butyracea]|uniref:Uncharacterized protein n=1 Tax=Rhodocollybia butyracea TaxID=206335 RepID=A0A9P5PCX5_9AGAR|nr:hypothetical protein BDP27DRAFT_1430734 [Rhodocollybia butyracea]
MESSPSTSIDITSEDTGTTLTVATCGTTTPTFEEAEAGDMGSMIIAELESVFLTSTEPSEEALEAYLSRFDGRPAPVVSFSVQWIENLTTAEEYDEFIASQHGTDPQDRRAGKVLFGDLDLGWYRTPLHKHRRYIPQEGDLLVLPPTRVPRSIRGIRCFSMTHASLLPFSLVTGTLILAGNGHERAMVLTPLLQQGHYHFLLCIQGVHDTFLIRAHENCMDRSWSEWEQMRREYGQGSFQALFSAGGDTLEQRLEGIRRQQKWHEWELRESGSTHQERSSFWTEAWEFCTSLICDAGHGEGRLADGPFELRRSISP